MSTVLGESPAAVSASAIELAQAAGPSGGPINPDVHGLGTWIENFHKYEATLQQVTKASTETRFKNELGTIDQWYNILSVAERTASVHMLLQRSDQDQIRFYISVLQQMIKPDVMKNDLKTEEDDPTKPKSGGRYARPPSLNLPPPGSPTTPTATSAISKDITFVDEIVLSNRLSSLRTCIQDDKNPTNLLRKGITGLPGLEMMNAHQLNLIANAGLSPEAQLLAVQLIMSGLVQPAGGSAQSQKTPTHPKKANLGEPKNWRSPASARYPSNALRSGLRAATLKNSSLKSAGVQSASLQSAGLESAGLESGSAMASPREEDFDPAMLEDIPKWLRSLRLHKYTPCFCGLPWQEMVVLDDNALKGMGVSTQGARGRLLRTFEHARKKMGIACPEGDASTTSTISPPVESEAPHSAAPASRLSISSPVFVPSYDRAPHSAAPTLSTTSTGNETE